MRQTDRQAGDRDRQADEQEGSALPTNVCVLCACVIELEQMLRVARRRCPPLGHCGRTLHCNHCGLNQAFQPTTERINRMAAAAGRLAIMWAIMAD